MHNYILDIFLCTHTHVRVYMYILDISLLYRILLRIYIQIYCICTHKDIYDALFYTRSCNLLYNKSIYV